MSQNYDFKKEWEMTKKNLIKFSVEAAEIAKKGEKELIKFSQKSKLQIDSAASTLKKEKLFYLIGKEYAKAKRPDKPSVKLTKLMEELKQVDGELKALKSKLKVKAK